MIYSYEISGFPSVSSPDVKNFDEMQFQIAGKICVRVFERYHFTYICFGNFNFL